MAAPGQPVGEALDIPTVCIGIVRRIKGCAETNFEFLGHKAITTNRNTVVIFLKGPMAMKMMFDMTAPSHLC